MITYHLTSRSIDMIPKALSLLRRRLISVSDFSSHTSEGIFDIMITADIPEGHEIRFQHLFEKIYELDTIEWWPDAESP